MVIGWCRQSLRTWILDTDVLLRHETLYFAVNDRISLTKMETKMMEIFLLRRHHIVSHDEIIDYCYDEYPEDLKHPNHNIDAYVYRLRWKVSSRLTIDNHHSRGYELR